MGLEALGPFVRGTHLNVAQIMLWVGLDAAPPWHAANGVCEDAALFFLAPLSPSIAPLADL